MSEQNIQSKKSRWRIILADDYYRKGDNDLENLKQTLEANGHVVLVFNGVDPKTRNQIRNPAQLADALMTLISQEQANGLVLDMIWFRDASAGNVIVKKLRRSTTHWDQIERLVIISQTASEYEPALLAAGVRKDCIFEKLTSKGWPKEIAVKFD